MPLLAGFRPGESTVEPFLNRLHCIAYRIGSSTGGATNRELLHTSDSCTMIQEMRSCSSHAATMDACRSRSNLKLSPQIESIGRCSYCLMTLANDSHMVRFQINTVAKKHPQSNATMQDAQTMIPAGLPTRPIRTGYVSLVCEASIAPRFIQILGMGRGASHYVFGSYHPIDFPDCQLQNASILATKWLAASSVRPESTAR